MSANLTEQIYGIMEREMDQIGPFIVKKQCLLIGADPNEIDSEDLPELASKLSEVMRTFGGYDKARKIYSEIKKLENLDLIVQKETSEEKRNKMLEDLGKTCIFTGEWDKAFEYFNKLLEGAKKAKDKRLASRYLRRLGFIHQERAEFDEALDYYELALENAKESGNKNAIAGSLNYIGTVYYYKGDYDLAEKYHEMAIENAEAVNNTLALGAAHTGLGNVHADSGEVDEAVKHYQKSLDYLRDTQHLHEIARVYNNLGDTYLQMEKWEKALEQFEKCKEHGEEGGWLNMKAWALFNSSEALISMGELDKAKENLDQSQDILKKIGDLAGIGGMHQNYGKLYRVKKDWDLSVMHYVKAIETFIEINTPLSLAECRSQLGEVFKAQGDVDGAKTEFRRAANLYHHLNLENKLKNVLEEIESLD